MTPHRLMRASAGTGKTYQLVRAYVTEVVERGIEPREIVAITFTRKAAEELRGRIRDALVLAREEARAQGRDLPDIVFEQLSRAPITNFHVLSLQLLRELGVRGGLPEGTQILGEHGEDVQLFVNAAEDAWFRGPEPTQAALRAVAPYFDVDRLAHDIFNAVSVAREHGVAIGSANIFAVAAQIDQAMLHDEMLAAGRHVEAGLTALTPKMRDTVRDWLAIPRPALADPPAQWARQWSKIFASYRRNGSAGTLMSGEDRDRLRDLPLAFLAESVEQRLRPHLLTLAHAAFAGYTQLKRRERAVDFTELVERAVHVLADEEHVHRDVRERVKAVLVDEAQDTNRLQLRLVRLLCGFEGPARDVPVAPLFVVGDWKQCIYTFRGADPQSFNRITQDVLERDGRDQLLEVSRRSSPNLIAAINHLGEAIFGSSYEALLPGPAQHPTEGFVWQRVPVPESRDAAVAEEADAVAQFVADEVQAGRRKAGDFALLLAALTNAGAFVRALTARGIPVVLGGGRGLYAQPEVMDVVALLSWLTNSADLLRAAAVLRSPLIGFSDSALHSVLTDRGHLTRLRLGTLEPPAWWSATDLAVLERAQATLPRLVRAAEWMNPLALLNLADSSLDIRAVYLALERGEQRMANLERLWAITAAAVKRGVSSSLRFARDQTTRVKQGYLEPFANVPSAERAALVLTSVHQAKGLEFPVVLLADTNRQKPSRVEGAAHYYRDHGIVTRPRFDGEMLKTRAWRAAADAAAQEETNETARLLYVAVTRAREHVRLFAPDADKGNGFFRLLAPWLQRAVPDGVVAVVGPVPPATPAQPAVVEEVDEVVEIVERLPAPPDAHFVLPVTTFETFAACLRLGHFVHHTGLSAWPGGGERRDAAEDDPPLPPLARGRLAHAVLAAMHRAPQAPTPSEFVRRELETLGHDLTSTAASDVHADVLAFLESPLGRAILALEPAQRRHEWPFQLALTPQLTLVGQIDLLYASSTGPVVLDYKHAKASPGAAARYHIQLGTYALAVGRVLGAKPPHRTQLVFLRDRAAPADYTVDLTHIEALERDAHRVTEALRQNVPNAFDHAPLPEPKCRSLECPFVTACHPASAPGAAKRSGRDALTQLTLAL